MTKSLELDTEMRWESADFIGASSRMIGCNRPDIKQQPPHQVEHTKNLRKKGGVHIESYCLENEASARVFHQGPGHWPNMIGCRTAVLHLLTYTGAALPHVSQRTSIELVLNGEPL
jgi:hypothetical protein